MVHIEINGVKLEVKQGSMIIEAADDAGIKIPRFCYHKKLSIAANCRMCLVEVVGGRKPLPACATPVTDGMKIFTESSLAIEAQRAVMEFLLINHPLDCPICDQGGECELQDVSVGFGNDVSQYTEGKRVVKDKNLGPLIATDMTRCIHCTRCVRFGKEIAGVREMGATGRGEHTEIGTYIEASVDSELSGNVIDICPVGALTSKPFRFKSRTWELKSYPTIAPHDCLGSNVNVHTKREQIYRVVPRENEAINEVWLSDRDRFSYEGITSDQRVKKPLIKEGGAWHEVDWQTALDFVATQLKRTMAFDGADNIGGFISSSSTLEEGYLFQQFFRAMGCNNVDHRQNQLDFSDQEAQPIMPLMGFPVAEIEQLDTILLLGSNIRKEQPLLAQRILKATQNNAIVMAINPIDYEFTFPVVHELISEGGMLLQALASVASALGINDKSLLKALKDAAIKPSQVHQHIAEHLQKHGNKKAIFLGQFVAHHPEAAQVRYVATLIADHIGATLVELTEGANSAGMWLAGCVPHRTAAGSVLSVPGLNAEEMISRRLKTYFFLNIEPELDFIHSGEVLTALQASNLVVCMTPFATPQMRQYATVILPTATFTETSGTFINIEGLWQSFEGVKAPEGDARPAWKILRVLGNLLGHPGFAYQNSLEIRDEIYKKWQSMPKKTVTVSNLTLEFAKPTNGLVRIVERPIYAIDGLVRRAVSLQKTKDALQAAVCVNAEVAKEHGLAEGMRVRIKQGDYSATLPLQIDARVPNHSLLLPSGLEETNGLGRAYGAIEIERVNP